VSRICPGRSLWAPLAVPRRRRQRSDPDGEKSQTASGSCCGLRRDRPLNLQCLADHFEHHREKLTELLTDVEAILRHPDALGTGQPSRELRALRSVISEVEVVFGPVTESPDPDQDPGSWLEWSAQERARSEARLRALSRAQHTGLKALDCAAW
jgi:hypothetical protein